MSKINYPHDNVNGINYQRIKQLHPLVEYCESHGIKLRRSGSRWVGRCPLHDEQKGEAFVVHPDQKWECYGRCAKQGDVTDLEMLLYGGTVGEAARRLDPVAGTVTTNNIISFPSPPILEKPKLLPTKKNPLAFPYVLSDEEIRQCHRFTVRLLEDHAYMEQVATFRQWKTETIRDLALDGYLGRDDEGHFCFNSAAGCKSRWREGAERRFKFQFGKSWLWRGELMPSVAAVYLCEGETDAITLIDRGLENDGHTVAVGMQGATLNIEPWALLFTNKHVVIAMDNDEAGQKADASIERILSTTAKSIKHFWSSMEVA